MIFAILNAVKNLILSVEHEILRRFATQNGPLDGFFDSLGRIYFASLPSLSSKNRISGNIDVTLNGIERRRAIPKHSILEQRCNMR